MVDLIRKERFHISGNEVEKIHSDHHVTVYRGSKFLYVVNEDDRIILQLVYLCNSEGSFKWEFSKERKGFDLIDNNGAIVSSVYLTDV